MFDAYHKWLGIVPKDQPPNHYRLLSLEPYESDFDVIEGAADRAMGFIRQYQSGEQAALAAKLLNEIATARLCLLKPKSKAEYDANLRRQSAINGPAKDETPSFLNDPEFVELVKSTQLATKKTKITRNQNSGADFLSAKIRGRTDSARGNLLASAPWLIGSAFAVVLLLFVIFGNSRPRYGTLIVELDQSDARILVQGNADKEGIMKEGSAGKNAVKVAAGKYRLRVEKDGFVTFAQEFEIQSGEQQPIHARLLPHDSKPAVAEIDKSSTIARQGHDEQGHDTWVKITQELPPEQQIDAVSKKLMELNPGFDGRFTPDPNRIHQGAVARIRFLSDFVTDLSPVCALDRLQVLQCVGSQPGKGVLQDLTPLRGMKLSEAIFENNPMMTSLSPLAGMPLRILSIRSTGVDDLEPLRAMPLTFFDCNKTAVSNLAPLSGMKLDLLDLGGTPVRDISVIQGMPLRVLTIYATQVLDLVPVQGMTTLEALHIAVCSIEDLAPLSGLKLTSIDLSSTKVVDLSPLEGMSLRSVFCTAAPITSVHALEGMPIEWLFLLDTQVGDLSPLHDMPLKELNIQGTKVSEISVVKSMPLKKLQLAMTSVADLTPLTGLELVDLGFTPERVKHGVEIVREMKTIEKIGDDWLRLLPPTEFWKKYDAGEFNTPSLPR